MSSPLTVDVQVVCDDKEIPAQADIEAWVEVAILQSGRVPTGDVEVAVRVVDADEIRTLNLLYREQDRPTNVLSFPSGEIDGLPTDFARPLGDIVICASIVASEASDQGKRPGDHWGHLLVHGALHLLGFDHETEPEAASMEALETEILASKDVADPYAGQ